MSSQQLYFCILHLKSISGTDLDLFTLQNCFASACTQQSWAASWKKCKTEIKFAAYSYLQRKYKDCLKIEPIFASKKTTNHWEFSLNTENFGVLGIFPKSTWNALLNIIWLVHEKICQVFLLKSLFVFIKIYQSF